MTKTMRERWAESFPPNMELWRLEYDAASDTALYQSKEHISANESHPENHRNPVFHVWKGDSWVHAGQNYVLAYRIYEQTIGGVAA